MDTTNAATTIAGHRNRVFPASPSPKQLSSPGRNTPARLGENSGMPTPQSQPQSDADRIIAAQREEARKTRNLLIWIFVGLPVVGLVIWGLVALAASGGAGNSGNGTTSSACDQRVSSGDIDLTACPLSGPLLTDASLCSAYTADNNQVTADNQTNPALYFASQHQVGDVVKFDNDCSGSPSETLAYTLQSEGLQP
jgi:uncharacterized protein YecT (DUF1311 family)